ncbi:dipeptidyl peptidase III [Halteromyces radiatus]|uniref:dipeptidyl peptidase III n=1 Tax=Halteromyces radiatus TaxID=101107 RepID=UPI00221E4FDC|nr:dipeptidyl peptidase III [Halteromyces radiatus]KAI8092459.1 dipeptidyl peptidase III [Halteromyces radiatus]
MSTATFRYLADLKAPFSILEAKPFFNSLDNIQKTYAHHMSRAAFEGTRIIITQTNPRAETIYDLILKIFSNKQGQLTDIQALQQRSEVSPETFEDLLQYSGQFLGNLSNYKSFGDEKFIPRISVKDFEKVVAASELKEEALSLFNQAKDEIYNVEPVTRNLLGYPDDGQLSGYYSDNITKDDIKAVQTYLEKINIDPLNTRLFKTDNGYDLAIASSDFKSETHILENGTPLTLKYGDFHEQMTKVAENIQSSIPVAANDNQRNMLNSYYDSFKTGSIEDHMESQRHWLRDIGPLVETNIGFIETYRDPQGVRAEWEGFVAMVNKEQTEKFNNLVQQAPLFVSRLPWPDTFERDTINKPDFTSLEVLSFATCGIPAGINIPNYTQVTQKLGSKNVSLGNVISASSPGEKFPFIVAEDLDLYKKLRNPAFEVQVGTHELGHGTGKLFNEDTDGKFDFDQDKVIHPFTQQPLSSWYKPGQTFSSVFGGIASSYEECRAECIALTLSPDDDILKIFGYEGQMAEDILYVMYLNMARAGLAALEYYDPIAKKWGQAHMQARYAITRIMMQAGDNFLSINKTKDDEGIDTLEIRLDRSKIRSIGRPAVATFLEKLQVYKATADVENGSKLYLETTSVPDDWVSMRDTVIRNKQPRKVFVQGNTFIDDDGQVILKEYEASPIGMIQSYIERLV